ncbi:MAG: radical SAM protein, partial [Pseudomonadota bacterium]
GKLASRPAAAVLREAEALAEAGVKELLVISQDTSAYGRDLRHAESTWRDATLRAHIQDLAEALSKLPVWTRLHYVYPYKHVDDLIPLMCRAEDTAGLVPYLDIPFQHAHPDVLKRMARPAASEQTLDRLHAWRALNPDLAIRSTFITGFPGETDAEFEFLLDWLKEARLDRVGCFAYEDVPGAASNALPDQVPEELKEERRARLMELSAQISAEKLAEKVGRRVAVLVDEVSEGGAVGRTVWDAPEVDGVVRMASGQPGALTSAIVAASDAHDLTGEPA